MARAYRAQAVAQFEASPIHPLTAHGAPASVGIYALYENVKEPPVYIGVAAGVKLRARLSRHERKISGATKIDVTSIWCRYLVIDEEGEEWIASAAEAHLIKHYEPKWNKSGFGSNVPGAGRPGIHAVQWDEWYPPRQKY